MIDDVAGHTMASASTVESSLIGEAADMSPIDQAKIVGETVANRASEQGVTQVVFDRGGYQFHGRVKAVAEAAREAGLKF